MVLQPSRARCGPIGCAISANGIGLAQVLLKGSEVRGARLAWAPHEGAATTEPEENDDRVAEHIRNMLDEGGFVGQRTVACVSPERLHYVRVTITARPGEDVATLIHEGVARDWDVPRNTLRVDYFEVPRAPAVKEHVDCIAVVASAPDISRHVLLLRQAGLTPMAMDSTAGAITRCVTAEACDTSGATTLMVEVTAGARTLILGRDGVPVFVCSKRSGRPQERARPPASTQGEAGTCASLSSGTDLASQPAPQLHDSVASDLALEVGKLLQYIGEDGLGHLVPRRGVIVGTDMLDGAALKRLANESGVDFLPLHLALRPFVSSCIELLPPAASLSDMLVPIGLALYGQEALAERRAA